MNKEKMKMFSLLHGLIKDKTRSSVVKSKKKDQTEVTIEMIKVIYNCVPDTRQAC